MKTFALKTFAAAFLFLLITSTNVLGFAGNSTNQATIDPAQQISIYLTNNGYSVSGVIPANDGTGNYVAIVNGARIIITPGLSIVAEQNLPN